MTEADWRAQRDDAVPEDVERLLATVPEWFGRPESNAEYIDDARRMETWTVRDEHGRVVGVTLVTHHFPQTSEIHFTVVDRSVHGEGVGNAMIEAITEDVRARGAQLLEVKTLGPSKDDPNYARTRHFYEKMGFLPLEETDLWGADTPCLIMVKPVGHHAQGGQGGDWRLMPTPHRLPPWPSTDPEFGAIRLRRVELRDAVMARDLSTDPYVPLTGTLPGHASREEAESWVRRQQGRHAEGRGFSFTIARRSDDEAVGHCGLWLKDLADGRASAGYAIAPSSRHRGYAAEALVALTNFAWTIPGLSRVELFIEPGNSGSLRTADRAGYVRERVLVEHQEIGGTRRDMVLYAASRPPSESVE